MLVSSILQDGVDNFPPNKWPTFDGHYLDRTEFLTSSEVAGCLRQAFFGKNPDEFPHKTFDNNGFAERGHAIEAWACEKFEYIAPKRGLVFEYLGKNQKSFYDLDLGLSGTPDGLLTLPNGDKVLLEFKSFDPRSNTNKFPKRKHIYQCIQNMYLLKHCLGVECKEARILYINASDVFDRYEHVVEWSDELFEECKERATVLWKASDPSELEPEGLHTGDCEYCKATKYCSDSLTTDKLLEAARSSKENFLLPPLGELDLTADEYEAVVNYVQSNDVKKIFDDELSDAKEKVDALLSSLGHDILLDDGRYIRRYTQAGRETADLRSMREAGLNVDNHIKHGKPFSQIRIVGKAKPA